MSDDEKTRTVLGKVEKIRVHDFELAFMRNMATSFLLTYKSKRHFIGLSMIAKLFLFTNLIATQCHRESGDHFKLINTA